MRSLVIGLISGIVSYVVAIWYHVKKDRRSAEADNGFYDTERGDY